MKGKYKQIGGIFFVSILFVGMFMGILLPDKLVSNTERRKLAQMPELSWESIMDNEYSDSLEIYLLEQFPGRDVFRMMKAEFDTRILRKSDSSGYAKIETHLFQIRTSEEEEQIQRAGELFQNITATYFEEANVYYSIVPDKNYFVDSLPCYDYQNTAKILAETFVMGTEIELWDHLELDDYYHTDLHLKQDASIPLANQLLDRMGRGGTTVFEYEMVLATEEFYGGYAANSAYYVQPDMLYYMENDIIRDATVYDYETGSMMEVYTLEKLEEMDDYDIFLGGARALLTIRNTQVENGRRLILFRDSFGSSIAPLLLNGYEEIILIDLRYVSADYAMHTVRETQGDVDVDDVLFLLNIESLYNSNAFKK